MYNSRTHGLPVELGVEKMLGITKEDIGKKISVDEYNAACRREVMKYTKEWTNLTKQMGYWVDLDNPYITYDNKYIETLWYLLKELYKKGYLYKGYTIQPYSPAAGTGLSSHVVNALAGQDIAIVSDVAGTTTDPVKKSMEIFGIGPCVLVDTAGLDDSGEVGEKRVAKSLESLKIIDIALLLISNNQFGEAEKEVIEQFKKYDLPFVIVHNKSDIQKLSPQCRQQLETFGAPVIECSAATKQGLEELIQAIVKTTPCKSRLAAQRPAAAHRGAPCSRRGRTGTRCGKTCSGRSRSAVPRRRRGFPPAYAGGKTRIRSRPPRYSGPGRPPSEGIPGAWKRWR